VIGCWEAQNGCLAQVTIIILKQVYSRLKGIFQIPIIMTRHGKPHGWAKIRKKVGIGAHIVRSGTYFFELQIFLPIGLHFLPIGLHNLVKFSNSQRKNIALCKRVKYSLLCGGA
jgi:hypothetical protein